MQSAGLFATMSFIVEIKTMQNGVRALNTSEKWPKYSPTNKKQSAVDIVINRIVDDVLTGHYKPGDKLPTEMQLAEMMSMSKNTVREAIKILVAYGAVEIRRPEGTFITHSFTPKMLNPVIYSLLFSKSNADDLLGLRRMIDTGVFLLIIDRGLDKEDEAALEAQHKLYSSLVLSRDADSARGYMLPSDACSGHEERACQSVPRLCSRSYGGVESACDRDVPQG